MTHQSQNRPSFGYQSLEDAIRAEAAAGKPLSQLSQRVLAAYDAERTQKETEKQ
jgi:hypothetical protein